MSKPKCTRCKTRISVATYNATTLGYGTTKRIGDEASSCLGCISPNSKTKLLGELPRYENCILNGIFRYIPPSTISINLNKVETDKTRYDALLDFTVKNVKTSVILEVDEPQHFTPKHQENDREREKIYMKKYNGYIVRIGVPNKDVVSSESSKSACHITNKTIFDYNCKAIADYVMKIVNNKKVSRHVFLNMSDNKGIRDFDDVSYMQIKNPGYTIMGVASSIGSGIFNITATMAKMAIGSSTCSAIVKSTGKPCTNAKKNGEFCGVHSK